MVDSSVLPTTIIQTVATLYSVFAALFIFTFAKRKDKPYKTFMFLFGFLSFIVLIALFYNIFILYLLCNNKSDVLLSISNFVSGKYDWSTLSYHTFIISSGYIVLFGKQLLNNLEDLRYDVFDYLLITSIGFHFFLVSFNLRFILLITIISFPSVWFITKFVGKCLVIWNRTK